MEGYKIIVYINEICWFLLYIKCGQEFVVTLEICLKYH